MIPNFLIFSLYAKGWKNAKSLEKKGKWIYFLERFTSFSLLCYEKPSFYLSGYSIPCIMLSCCDSGESDSSYHFVIRSE